MGCHLLLTLLLFQIFIPESVRLKIDQQKLEKENEELKKEKAQLERDMKDIERQAEKYSEERKQKLQENKQKLDKKLADKRAELKENAVTINTQPYKIPDYQMFEEEITSDVDKEVKNMEGKLNLEQSKDERAGTGVSRQVKSSSTNVKHEQEGRERAKEAGKEQGTPQKTSSTQVKDEDKIKKGKRLAGEAKEKVESFFHKKDKRDDLSEDDESERRHKSDAEPERKCYLRSSAENLKISVSMTGETPDDPTRSSRQQQETGPMVNVKPGKLEGKYMRTPSGKQVEVYLGIPYAKPPIGRCRFKDPLPLQSWPGVWRANNFRSTCIQVKQIFQEGEDIIRGEEDCLYLNVYTPRKNPEKPFDVIVYIHGGAYMWGASSDYDPLYLVEKGVIYVSMNYRLNLFGFLSTQDEVLTGNFGLKDQSVAIAWVKNNIEAFGGNPDSITLAGFSAGGSSVHFHYLSPWSKGLFHRGISVSGSASNHWSIAKGSEINAKKLANLVGCPTSPTDQMLSCLRRRPAIQLEEQVLNIMVYHYVPFAPFGPVIEKGATPFVDKHPAEILLEGKQHQLPWLASITTDEGIYPFGAFIEDETKFNFLSKNFNQLLPHIMDYNFTVPPEKLEEVTKKISEFYTGNKMCRKGMIQMATDRVFVTDVERSARLQAASSSQPVYMYQFAYRPKHSFSELMTGGKTTDWGVGHGDDVLGIVPINGTYNTRETKEDQEMYSKLIDMWLTYAKTGVPKFGSGDAYAKWNPVTADSTNLMIINATKSSKMASTNDLGNREFWDSLPIQEQQLRVFPNKKKSSK